MRLKSHLIVCAAVAALGSVSQAQVTGKVSLDGKAPERAVINMAAVPDCAKLHANPVLEETVVAGNDGELANVVVSLRSLGDKELAGDAPKEPAVLDQKGCTYHPHVVGMVVGQDLVVKNSDSFLHNVHGLPFDNDGFNFAQPSVDPGKVVMPKPKTPERFSIKCDVHPWMLAHVNVFAHPYFAVSNEKGEFSIPTKGLADGKYGTTFWQEKFGEQEGPDIEVKGGKAALAEPFKVKQEAAAAEPLIKPALASALLSKSAAGAQCDCCDEKEASAVKTAAKAGN